MIIIAIIVMLSSSQVVQVIISYALDPPGVLAFAWTPVSMFWIGLSGQC